MSEKVPFERVANPPKQGKSCWFYGCIAAAIAGLLGVGVVAFSGWWVYKKLNFTSDEPVALPAVEVSDEELEEIETRVDTFASSLAQNEPVEDFKIDGSGINALILKHAKFGDEDAPFRVAIEGDALRAQFSLPLDKLAEELDQERLRGRYLNGAGSLSVRINDGKLQVSLRDLEVNGNKIPDNFAQAIENRNLMEDVQLPPEARETIQKFERIAIESGRLVIVPKKTKAGQQDHEDKGQ